MAIEVDLPNRGRVQGMAIRKGVTLIGKTDSISCWSSTVWSPALSHEPACIVLHGGCSDVVHVLEVPAHILEIGFCVLCKESM